MIKDAIKYIVDELSHAERYMINGDEYSDKQLYRIDPYFPKAKAIGMSTLTSLVEYIKANIDSMEKKYDHSCKKSGNSRVVFLPG